VIPTKLLRLASQQEEACHFEKTKREDFARRWMANKLQ
jgi:hypothetical protein